MLIVNIHIIQEKINKRSIIVLDHYQTSAIVVVINKSHKLREVLNRGELKKRKSKE